MKDLTLTLTSLVEVLGKRRSRTKLASRQRQRLLRLTVKDGILNERVDENPHVTANLRRLDSGRLVLLRNGGDQILRDLIRDCVDVSTTLRSGD